MARLSELEDKWRWCLMSDEKDMFSVVVEITEMDSLSKLNLLSFNQIWFCLSIFNPSNIYVKTIHFREKNIALLTFLKSIFLLHYAKLRINHGELHLREAFGISQYVLICSLSTSLQLIYCRLFCLYIIFDHISKSSSICNERLY
jgi:hypothetical protein